MHTVRYMYWQPIFAHNAKRAEMRTRTTNTENWKSVQAKIIEMVNGMQHVKRNIYSHAIEWDVTRFFVAFCPLPTAFCFGNVKMTSLFACRGNDCG